MNKNAALIASLITAFVAGSAALIVGTIWLIVHVAGRWGALGLVILGTIGVLAWLWVVVYNEEQKP